MKIKKDDKVIVLTGKDKGKTGTVTKAMPKEGKVVVSGVNVLKVHQKPRKGGQKGQIIDKTMPINASNVRLAEKKSKKSKASK
ncbi:MAG: 50S ribosomal protein L24 [Candidatus Zambryskibacteria bacterium]|nr:50S ribosomal protein L24 [Candidatus Zambryskibacteria bacterium]